MCLPPVTCAATAVALLLLLLAAAQLVAATRLARLAATVAVLSLMLAAGLPALVHHTRQQMMPTGYMLQWCGRRRPLLGYLRHSGSVSGPLPVLWTATAGGCTSWGAAYTRTR